MNKKEMTIDEVNEYVETVYYDSYYKVTKAIVPFTKAPKSKSIETAKEILDIVKKLDLKLKNKRKIFKKKPGHISRIRMFLLKSKAVLTVMIEEGKNQSNN